MREFVVDPKKNESDNVEWISVMIPDEFVSFLKNKVSRENNREKITKLVNNVLLYFYNNKSLKMTVSKDYSITFVDDNPYIIYPLRSNIVKLERVSNGRLYCSYHQFLYMDCPHTIWASLSNEIEKWMWKKYEAKILEPRLNMKALNEKIHIRRTFYDHMKKSNSNDEEVIPNIIVQSVLNHYGWWLTTTVIFDKLELKKFIVSD